MLIGPLRFSLIAFMGAAYLAAGNLSIPLYFERNQGQTNPSVSYIARDSGEVRLFTPYEVLWQLGNTPTSFLKMAFRNPDPSLTLEGRGILPGKANYLSDGRRNSVGNVDCYSALRYQSVFPGIDVDFHGSSNSLEYDVIVNPGANPDQMRFLISGAKNFRITDSGDLVFETSAGEIRHRAPVSWQVIDGVRRPVAVHFKLEHHGSDAEVGFLVDSWDRSAALTIDPVVVYDQTISGSGTVNGITQMKVDSTGNVYVAGVTNSPDFPVTNALSPIAPVMPVQSFVAKLKADGSGFSYVTYFAPALSSIVSALAIDAAGDAWLAGTTHSPDFPLTQNAVDRVFNGGSCSVINFAAGSGCSDGFVFGLNPSGDTQVYGTFLGGSGVDSISAMIVGGDGTIWVTGGTTSTDFPVTSSAMQAELNGPQDAFLVHFDPRSSSLSYSTYFGGSGNDSALSIATDLQGNIYIGGDTDSSDLPTSPGALQPFYGGGSDIFLAKFPGFNPSAPLFVTYWGHSNGDILNALTTDSAGNVYAGAVTSQLPITLGGGGLFLSNSGASLLKIDTGGSRIIWSNTSLSVVQSMAIDPQGRLTVLGASFVNPPLTANALATCNGPGGGFLLQLNTDGSVHYGSGASGTTLGLGPTGNVYIGGNSLIEKQDFSQDPPMAATCILGWTQHYADAIAPGEIFSIYGRNLGPAQGVIAAYDASQRLPFMLGGVSVSFDGAPAPLLYAQAGQINAIVPFSVAGKKSSSLKVAFNGAAVPTVTVPLRDASDIALTTNGNLIAAINEDGTMNSKDHPAKPGSVVAIFSSGGGQTNPPSPDGQIVNAALPLALQAKVMIGSGGTLVPAEVSYAGSAPGLLAGTAQINFRIPLNLPPSLISPGNPNYNIAIVIGQSSGISTSGSIFVQ